MPIRKVKDQYYWGSKGPFKTRKQAVSVGQAAYASGYKEKEMPNPTIQDVHIEGAMQGVKRVNKKLDEAIGRKKRKKKKKV